MSLHLLEDVLGRVAVLIGSIIMYFTNRYILDPILSLIITIYILFGVAKNLKSVLLIFLETSPKHTNTNTITKEIKNLNEVDNIHDIHFRSLDGEKTMMTAHIIPTNKANISILKHKIKELLEQHNIHHSTIEFDTKEEEHCHHCN